MSESKKSTGLEYRSDFPDVLFDSFSEDEPVKVVGGTVNEKIIRKGKDLYVKDLLVEKALNCNRYQLVIYYDTTEKHMEICDSNPSDLSGNPSPMEELWGELGIEAKSSTNDDLVPSLVDKNLNKIDGQENFDSAFLSIISSLAEHPDVSFCVIIDNGDVLFPCQDERSTREEGHVTFKRRLQEISKALKESKNRNLIIIDAENRLEDELPFASHMNVPASTEAEVRDVLKKAVRNKDKLVAAVQYGITVDIRQVMGIAKRFRGDDDKIIDALVQKRVAKIEEMSGGLLTGGRGFSDDEVELSPKLKSFSMEIAALMQDDPESLEHGVILLGPPGVGKSVIPAYIARCSGVPFLKTTDFGTETLSGKSLMKVKNFFRLIEANKPCIVFLDELDKMLPNTTMADRHNNNDDQMVGVFQSMLADEDRMRGIVIFGATNYLENLDPAMVGHHRFGRKIAVLPPQDVPERIAVFKAVWNQLGYDQRYEMYDDDEALAIILKDLPDHFTGSVAKAMLKASNTDVKLGRTSNIWDSVMRHAMSMIQGTKWKKDAEFDDFIKKALIQEDDTYYEGPDDVEMSGEMQQLVDLVERKRKVEKDEERLDSERTEFDAQRGAVGVALREHSEKLKAGDEKLRAERERLKAEEEKLRAKEEEARSRCVGDFRGIYEEHSSKYAPQIAHVKELLLTVQEVRKEDVNDFALPEVRTKLAKTDDILRRLSDYKKHYEIYGLWGPDIDQIEAAFTDYREKLVGIEKDMLFDLDVNDRSRPNSAPPEGISKTGKVILLATGVALAAAIALGVCSSSKSSETGSSKKEKTALVSKGKKKEKKTSEERFKTYYSALSNVQAKGDLAKLEKLVGKEEIFRLFSGVRSQSEFEIMVRNLHKIRENYLSLKDEDGFSSRNDLFKYALQNLGKMRKGYKITNVAVDNFEVTYDADKVSRIVYRVYAPTKSLFRIELVSINGRPYERDLSKGGDYASTFKKSLIRDLEKMVKRK